jgi:hypothetical protein
MKRESEDLRARTGGAADGDLPGSYPETIEKLSANWRQLRVDEREGGKSSGPAGWAKHYLPLGIGLGVLLIALLIVIGGLAFLVWNGGR